MGTILPIVMPKWGLAMQDGIVVSWDVDEGEAIDVGQEFMEIETTKITNVFESPVSGTLRRKVAEEGETLPVGALMGVVADDDVSDDDIGQFIEKFQSEFVPPDPDEESGPEPEFVEIGDGRRIRFLRSEPEDGGDETSAIFIHGFGSDHASWLFNQTDIGAQRPTFAIDLPGHGGSTKDVGAGNVEALASDVIAFMKGLDIDRAHLIGHSLGGATALAIAQSDPSRVASLSLIAPAGLGDDISTEFIEGFLSQKRARKLRGVLEQLVDNPDLITAEMIEDVIRFKRLDGAQDALQAIAGAVFAGGRQAASFRETLALSGVPSVVVWGRNDRIIPHTHSEDLGDGVDKLVIDETGHLPHMERSSQVNEALHAVMRDG